MKRKVMAVVLVMGLVLTVFGSGMKKTTAEAKTERKMPKMEKVTGSVVKKEMGEFDSFDSFTFIKEESCELPYYVGKEKKSYLAKQKYDRVVYLGLPLYLKGLYEGAEYYAVSNGNVAKIEGAELVPLKQGKTTLIAYNAEKKEIKRELIAVTTFNDGKDVIKNRSFEYISPGAYDKVRDVEYWRDCINTINDMVYYLEARHFVYDYVEPQYCGIEMWQWTADAESIYDYSKGVCVQVAQVANYMLANNYEDWGNILVFGKQGHIFNWFYEDGFYYIMDFTEVISDNQWGEGRNGGYLSQYIGYEDRIRKFATVDEIKEYIQTEKVELDKNYLVVMFSCQGNDYMPAWLDGGMNCCDDIYNHRTKETIVFGVQDIVAEELTVLWKDPEFDMEIKGFSLDEMPATLRKGLYGAEKEIKHYFNY